MSFTRRTHVVRISDAKPGDPPSQNYVDVEVLDAISFRVENGQEVILSMAASNSAPLIVDDTGGGHGKRPAHPTQRTHMKRIVSEKDSTQKLDVEVLDVMAFRGANNQEWILDMQATTGEGPVLFDETTGVGTNQSTRRVHEEKITDPYGSKDATGFVTMQRDDAIAFRTINGQEVIVSCPSADDGTQPRASTFIWSPTGYDPADESGPVPPVNSDPHVYVAFVAGANGFLTGAEKIQMGPFWWIRKVSTSNGYILITVDASVTVNGSVPPPLPAVVLKLGKGEKLVNEVDKSIASTTGGGVTQRIYFVWEPSAPFPTVDNYQNVVALNVFPNPTYASQFSQIVDFNFGGFRDTITTPIAPAQNGFYSDFASAQAIASEFNDFYGRLTAPITIEWFDASGVAGGQNTSGSTWSEFVVGFLDVPLGGPPTSTTTIQNKYLISVPSPLTHIAVTVTGVETRGTSTVTVKPISDRGTLKTVADAVAATADNNGAFGTRTNDETPYDVTSQVKPGTPPKAHNIEVLVDGRTAPPHGGGGGIR